MRIREEKKQRKAWPFVCLAMLLILGEACSKKEETGYKVSPPLPETEKEAESRIVLEVGGTRYSALDFKNYVKNTFGEGASSLEPSTWSRLFDEFFESKLLLHAARSKGIIVTEEEKSTYLDRLRKGEVEESKELWELDSDDLEEKLIIEKYVSQITQNESVDEEEIRRYYELHKSEFFLPERIQVSQILLLTEAEAVDIWEKVKHASEEDFRAAARAKSIGPEAARGGEMGVYQKGQLPLEMETAIFSLAEGEVSPVIKSPYGFHIFRLDRKFESEWLSLEEVSASIRSMLLDVKIKQAIRLHVQNLEARTAWQIYPENLFFPYQRNKE